MRNVIKMALKLLFFAAKSQKLFSGWGLCSQAPFVKRLNCISLFSKGLNYTNSVQKNLLLVQVLSLLAKSWLHLWSHSLLQTDFSSNYIGCKRNEQINAASNSAARLIRLFFQTFSSSFFIVRFSVRVAEAAARD